MKLHISGEQVKEGWKILNIQKKPGVDFVGDIRSLNSFADNTCKEVYASHVLEHAGLFESENIIKNIYRILQKDGKFYISVPDLEIITQLFLDENEASKKLHYMRIIYGGQMDAHDFHYCGYWQAFLFNLLKKAGFSEYQRVDLLNIFNDASIIKINDKLISLNVIAIK